MIHDPWVRWARERITGVEWDLLDAVVIPRERHDYPDFVSPPPREPQAQLEAELRRVLETPTRRRWPRSCASPTPSGVPEARAGAVDAPARRAGRASSRRCARGGTRCWRRSGRGSSRCSRRRSPQRGRRLADVGPAAAFADLSDQVVWRDGRVEVDAPRDPGRKEVDLAGRGLLLVPAVFAWPDVWPMNDPPWQPSIVYAPRGVAELWAPREGASAGASPPRSPTSSAPAAPRSCSRSTARSATVELARAPGRQPGRRVRAPEGAGARGAGRRPPRRAPRALRAHPRGRPAAARGRGTAAPLRAEELPVEPERDVVRRPRPRDLGERLRVEDSRNDVPAPASRTTESSTPSSSSVASGRGTNTGSPAQASGSSQTWCEPSAEVDLHQALQERRVARRCRRRRSGRACRCACGS